MDKLPSHKFRHIYEYDNTYKTRFGKVLNQLSAHIFTYRCSECFKEWNKCFCYCKKLQNLSQILPSNIF